MNIIRLILVSEYFRIDPLTYSESFLWVKNYFSYSFNNVCRMFDTGL